MYTPVTHKEWQTIKKQIIEEAFLGWSYNAYKAVYVCRTRVATYSVPELAWDKLFNRLRECYCLREDLRRNPFEEMVPFLQYKAKTLCVK